MFCTSYGQCKKDPPSFSHPIDRSQKSSSCKHLIIINLSCRGDPNLASPSVSLSMVSFYADYCICPSDFVLLPIGLVHTVDHAQTRISPILGRFLIASTPLPYLHIPLPTSFSISYFHQSRSVMANRQVMDVNINLPLPEQARNKSPISSRPSPYLPATPTSSHHSLLNQESVGLATQNTNPEHERLFDNSYLFHP